ncbi:copper metabolism (Murr1) domain containing 1 [Columba livia]|uniref:COMM domain-containing protein 1 n=1 Tax=Columba livia TaxID=8932 RepID=A0A2I0LT60_COLLI|nr:copper metabolism (Murr1) domain containing 1 [Columba livia]
MKLTGNGTTPISEGSLPPPEGSKPLSGLLGGIAQAAYYGNADITEELLRGQLYPEAAPEEFRALRAKMGGLLQSIASADMDLNQLDAFLTAQTKKQGGITSDQAAVIAKFWKNHRMKIHESLINQSRWDNLLKNMNWRVDLKSQSRHIDQINTPVAIVEMELGKNGQESEFLCLEFDEAKLSQMLKKLSEIEDSMTLLTQTT